MAKKVTSKQIMYASAAIIITTSLLTKQLYIYTKNEAWIAVLAGGFMSLIVVLIYSSLTKRFPGLSLIEINETVFGKVLGKFISALYIYFFFTIACLNANIAGGFVKEFVLPNTPVIFILFLFIIVCLLAVRKGPSNMLMNSPLITFISITVLLVNTLLLLTIFDMKNLLPVFNLKPIEYIVGTHTISVIPLSDPIVLLMFLPDMQKTQGIGKALSKGLMLGTSILLLIVLRDISVLGSGLSVYNFPTLISVRQIDVGDIVTRMDIVYISILIMLMFYKVSVFYYASVAGIQRLFKFRSYQFMVNISGVLLLIYAMTVFRSAGEHFEWLVNGAASIHNTFFAIVLPLLTCVVAVFRGMYKGSELAAS